jgi:hypothetical protein
MPSHTLRVLEPGASMRLDGGYWTMDFERVAG